MVAVVCKYLTRTEILDVHILFLSYISYILIKIGEDPSYYIGKNSRFSKNKDLQNGKLWD